MKIGEETIDKTDRKSVQLKEKNDGNCLEENLSNRKLNRVVRFSERSRLYDNLGYLYALRRTWFISLRNEHDE